jgi:hypothetical protein
MNNLKNIILSIACAFIAFAVSLLIYFQNTNLFGFEITIAIFCGVIAGMALFKSQQFEKNKNLPLKLMLAAFIILIFMILLYVIHGFVFRMNSALGDSAFILILFFLSLATIYIIRKIIYFNNKSD